MEKRNPAGGDDYRIRVGSIITGKETLSLSTWLHIAVTHDINSTTIYVNGNSIWNSNPNTFNSTPVSAGIEIGGPVSAFNYYFDGVIDEVRISQTVRYTGNFTPPSEPFTAD